MKWYEILGLVLIFGFLIGMAVFTVTAENYTEHIPPFTKGKWVKVYQNSIRDVGFLEFKKDGKFYKFMAGSGLGEWWINPPTEAISYGTRMFYGWIHYDGHKYVLYRYERGTAVKVVELPADLGEKIFS